MTRRDFTKGLFAAGLAAGLPSLFAAEAESPSAALKVTRYSVAAGASRPFRVLHVSDTHLSLVDRIDGQPSPRNAEERAKCFPRAEEGLNAALAYARERGETIVHTGDLIDYVNDGNLAVAGKMADLAPGGVFAAGNHEYCKMVGDGKVEDEAYKAESRARVQSAYPGNLLFASRVVNGVNFVSIDDAHDDVTQDQVEAFAKEVKKGLPIILLMHVPFPTPHIVEATRKYWAWNKKFRNEPPKPITFGKRGQEFIKYLKSEPLLKGILAGHMHITVEERFSPTAVQYLVAGNFAFAGREVLFT